MAEDLKYTIKKIVDAITVKKDNGSTDAALIFLYEGGPETLKELFVTYDVVTTFSDARVVSTRFIQNKPVHHPETYPVNVLSLDKYVAGVLVCTADKMQEKMKVQMRTVIEAAAKSVGFRLKIATEVAKNRRVGGVKLWKTTYNIVYEDV